MFRILAGAALGLVLLALGMVWSGAEKNEAPPNGAKTQAAAQRIAAPEFALQNLDGALVRLSDFEGQVRIVNFWATWCPPCRQEIPDFQALSEKYGDRGLTVIGISLDQTGPDAVRTFAEQIGMTYHTVMGAPETAHAYGDIRSIPTTFVIDQRGHIYQKYIGYRNFAVFERDVLTLFKEDEASKNANRENRQFSMENGP